MKQDTRIAREPGIVEFHAVDYLGVAGFREFHIEDVLQQQVTAVVAAWQMLCLNHGEQPRIYTVVFSNPRIGDGMGCIKPAGSLQDDVRDCLAAFEHRYGET